MLAWLLIILIFGAPVVIYGALADLSHRNAHLNPASAAASSADGGASLICKAGTSCR